MARSSVRHRRSLIDVEVGDIHVAPCCDRSGCRARCDLRLRSDYHREYHQENQSLKALHLYWNSIRDEGASALADSLVATLLMRTPFCSPKSRV